MENKTKRIPFYGKKRNQPDNDLVERGNSTISKNGMHSSRSEESFQRSSKQNKKWVSDNIYWTRENAIAIKKRKKTCIVRTNLDEKGREIDKNVNASNEADQSRIETLHNEKISKEIESNEKQEKSYFQGENLNQGDQKDERSSLQPMHVQRTLINKETRFHNNDFFSCDSGSEYEADDELVQNQFRQTAHKKRHHRQKESKTKSKGLLNNSAMDWEEPRRRIHYGRLINERIEKKETSLAIKKALTAYPICCYEKRQFRNRRYQPKGDYGASMMTINGETMPPYGKSSFIPRGVKTDQDRSKMIGESSYAVKPIKETNLFQNVQRFKENKNYPISIENKRVNRCTESMNREEGVFRTYGDQLYTRAKEQIHGKAIADAISARDTVKKEEPQGEAFRRNEELMEMQTNYKKALDNELSLSLEGNRFVNKRESYPRSIRDEISEQYKERLKIEKIWKDSKEKQIARRSSEGPDNHTDFQNFQADVTQKLYDILKMFKEEMKDCKMVLEKSLSQQENLSVQQKEAHQILKTLNFQTAPGTQAFCKITKTPAQLISESDRSEGISVKNESEIDTKYLNSETSINLKKKNTEQIFEDKNQVIVKNLEMETRETSDLIEREEMYMSDKMEEKIYFNSTTESKKKHETSSKQLSSGQQRRDSRRDSDTKRQRKDSARRSSSSEAESSTVCRKDKERSSKQLSSGQQRRDSRRDSDTKRQKEDSARRSSSSEAKSSTVCRKDKERSSKQLSSGQQRRDSRRDSDTKRQREDSSSEAESSTVCRKDKERSSKQLSSGQQRRDSRKDSDTKRQRKDSASEAELSTVCRKEELSSKKTFDLLGEKFEDSEMEVKDTNCNSSSGKSESTPTKKENYVNGNQGKKDLKQQKEEIRNSIPWTSRKENKTYRAVNDKLSMLKMKESNEDLIAIIGLPSPRFCNVCKTEIEFLKDQKIEARRIKSSSSQKIKEKTRQYDDAKKAELTSKSNVSSRPVVLEGSLEESQDEDNVRSNETKENERKTNEEKKELKKISLETNKGFTKHMAQILRQVSKDATEDPKNFKTANILLNLGGDDKSKKGEFQHEMINVNVFLSLSDQEDNVTTKNDDDQNGKSQAQKLKSSSSYAVLLSKCDASQQTDYVAESENVAKCEETPFVASESSILHLPEANRIETSAAALLGVQCQTHFYSPNYERKPVPQLRKIGTDTLTPGQARCDEAMLCCFVKREANALYPNETALGNVILLA